MGISFKYDGKPVAQVISENMWISFAIALVATVLQFLIAIPLGIVSATKQYSAADYIVTVFTMIGISLPTYFFGAIVIKIFAADLGWLPFGGLLDASASYPETFAGFLQKSGDVIVHMIMPIFVSVILSLGRAYALHPHQHAGSAGRRLHSHGARQRSVGKDGYLQARLPQHPYSSCHHACGAFFPRCSAA